MATAPANSAHSTEGCPKIQNDVIGWFIFKSTSNIKIKLKMHGVVTHSNCHTCSSSLMQLVLTTKINHVRVTHSNNVMFYWKQLQHLFEESKREVDGSSDVVEVKGWIWYPQSPSGMKWFQVLSKGPRNGPGASQTPVLWVGCAAVRRISTEAVMSHAQAIILPTIRNKASEQIFQCFPFWIDIFRNQISHWSIIKFKTNQRASPWLLICLNLRLAETVKWFFPAHVSAKYSQTFLLNKSQLPQISRVYQITTDLISDHHWSEAKKNVCTCRFLVARIQASMFGFLWNTQTGRFSSSQFSSTSF